MNRIILTMANFQENYFPRKTEYVKGLNSVFWYKKPEDTVHIVESVKKQEYFNDYDCEVFVGTNDNPNKGVNEVINLKNFLMSKNFDDEDNVIKVTGRYEFINSSFFNEVNKGRYDIYYNNDSIPGTYNKHAEPATVHTFCLSMKFFLWKEFFSIFREDISAVEPIEFQFRDFINSKTGSLRLDYLGLLVKPYTKPTHIM